MREVVFKKSSTKLRFAEVSEYVYPHVDMYMYVDVDTSFVNFSRQGSREVDGNDGAKYSTTIAAGAYHLSHFANSHSK